MATEKQIIKVMNQIKDQHIDSLTGELNCTGLAEEACQILNGYDGDDIPESYFELATKVDVSFSQEYRGVGPDRYPRA